MRVFVLVGWIAWITSGSLGLSAIVQEDLLMMSNLKRVSPPQEMSFANGYEVVAGPTADAKPLKVMPAGSAKVAANLDVDGRRYYMTDWSYERLQQGLSYNWIRPLGAEAGQPRPPAPPVVVTQDRPPAVKTAVQNYPGNYEGPKANKVDAKESTVRVRTVSPANVGDPLSKWLPLKKSPPALSEPKNGKRYVVCSCTLLNEPALATFPIPDHIQPKNADDPILHSLACELIRIYISVDAYDAYEKLTHNIASSWVESYWTANFCQEIMKEMNMSRQKRLLMILDGNQAGSNEWRLFKAKTDDGKEFRIGRSGEIQAEIHPESHQFGDEARERSQTALPPRKMSFTIYIHRGKFKY